MRREHNIQSGILPSGYRQLEYIESTGTQYIDTNFPASSTLNISFNVYIIDKVWPYDGGYYTSFAGNRDGYNGLNNPCICWILSKGSNSLYINYYYQDLGSVFSPFYLNTWYNVSNEANKFYVNGNLCRTATAANFSNGTNIYLFRSNGSYRITQRLRISTCTMFDTSTLNSRNFIPVLRIADSKPGLYDLAGSICPLTGTPFYVNAGTGEFLYN